MVLNVQTLKVAILCVFLPLNKYGLDSVADFLNTEARAPTSAERAFVNPRGKRSSLDV